MTNDKLLIVILHIEKQANQYNNITGKTNSINGHQSKGYKPENICLKHSTILTYMLITQLCLMCLYMCVCIFGKEGRTPVQLISGGE